MWHKQFGRVHNVGSHLCLHVQVFQGDDKEGLLWHTRFDTHNYRNPAAAPDMRLCFKKALVL